MVVHAEQQMTQFLNTGQVQIEVVLFRSLKESRHQPDLVHVLDPKLQFIPVHHFAPCPCIHSTFREDGDVAIGH